MNVELPQALWDGFQRARHGNQTAGHDFQALIGGHRVAFSIFGPQLAARTRRPFDHLRLPPGDDDPVLRVELWDEGESGVGCEGCEIDDSIDVGKGDIVTVSENKRFVSLRRARSHAVYDRHERVIRGWSNNGERCSLIEIGRPLQYLVCYWLCDAGDQLLHSGMIAKDDIGLLIAGKSGSGKSTTSLLCLEAGLQYVGDDLLALQGDAGAGFVAHGVYGSNHLAPSDLERWPALGEHTLSDGCVETDKCVVMVQQAFPGLLLASCPIGGILLPRIVSQATTTLRPATQGEALRTIAPSSIALIEGLIPAGLRRIGSLVETVPAYWLELGRDFHSTPPVVHNLMRSLQAKS